MGESSELHLPRSEVNLTRQFAIQQSNINNLRGPFTFAAAQYRMAGHELANADLEWRAAMERRRIAEAALEAIRLS